MTEVLKQEEERFFATIEHGMAILEAELAAMAKSGNKVFNGETAFKLHDTYGFPLDLTPGRLPRAWRDGGRGGFRCRDGAARRNRRAPPANSRWRPIWNTTARPPPSTATTRWKHKGNVLALYKDGTLGQRTEGRRDGRGGAGRHAVLRRIRRPGGRLRRAAQRAWHFRGGRHAENPGQRVRPSRRGARPASSPSATA